MKLFRVLSGALAAMGLCAGMASAAAPVSGTYLEARNANVFVGACHFGSEYQTLGKDAILAWHVSSGTRNGASLAGLNVVAVVAGNDNLAEAASERSTVIYVDSRATSDQSRALVSLAQDLAGKSLGTIQATHSAPIRFEAAGDHFRVAVPGAAMINASRLADRACCIMPYAVWYHPLAAVQHPIVGAAVENRYMGADLHTSWSYPGQNSAFIGEFTQ